MTVADWFVRFLWGGDPALHGQPVAPDAEVEGFLDDDVLLEIARKQLATDELAHYGSFSDELLVDLPAQWEAVRRTLDRSHQSLRVSHRLLTASRKRFEAGRRWRSALCGLAFAVLTIAGGVYLIGAFRKGTFLLGPPSLGDWSPTGREVFYAFVAFASAGVVLTLTSRAIDWMPAAGTYSVDLAETYSKETAFFDERRVAVTEALRRTINAVLGETDQLLFPADAPALVELDSARIIDSSTIEEIQRFIHQHSASAIGVAGPRGIGKTTILRRITEPTDDADLGVLVPAPVKYDQAEFTRRLFSEVIAAAQERSLSGGPTRFPRSTTRSRAHLVRMFSAVALLVCGLGLFGLEALDAPSLKPSNLQVLGGMCILFGVILIGAWLVSTFRSAFVPPASLHLPPELRVIDDALSVLRWREEVTSVSKTTFKPLAGLLEATEDDSRKETSVELTNAEVVAQLRVFLRDYRRAADLRRIVVAIDELDKLARPEFLVDAINGLKDLFHIDGTHFVVSVSTDALDSFALRGVPARDAFDSSFDTIIPIRRLQAAQSIALMEARAAGFPAPLVLFCHAWSGGLPRDLVRSARACIEVYADGESTNQAALVRNVVETAVARALASYARSRQLSAHPAVRGAMNEVRGEDLRTAAVTLTQVEEIVEQPDEVRVLRHYLEVAQDVLDEHASSVPLDQWGTVGSDPKLLARSDGLAIKMAAVGDSEIELLAGVNWTS